MEPNMVYVTTMARMAIAPVPPSGTTATDIRGAWIAACIGIVLTLAVTLGDAPGSALGDLSAWWLPGWWPIDVSITALLAVGIRAGSRAGAVAMLAYFLVSKAILLSQHATVSAILLALMFTYCFWNGVRGVSAWHRQRKRADRNT